MWRWERVQAGKAYASSVAALLDYNRISVAIPSDELHGWSVKAMRLLASTYHSNVLRGVQQGVAELEVRLIDRIAGEVLSDGAGRGFVPCSADKAGAICEEA